MTFWSGDNSLDEVPANDNSTFAKKGLSETPTTRKGGAVAGGRAGIEVLGSTGDTLTAFSTLVIWWVCVKDISCDKPHFMTSYIHKRVHPLKSSICVYSPDKCLVLFLSTS